MGIRSHYWKRDLTHYMQRLRYEMDADIRHFSYDPSQQGATNCIIFASEVVKIIRPDLEFPQVLTGYTTPLKAARKIIKEEGVKDMPSLLAKYFQEKGVAYAQRGDIVLVESVDDPTFPLGVAIAEPPHYWGVTPEGLGYGPLGMATHCFSVDQDLVEDK